MATQNPIVSTITGYVEQNSDELLVASVLGARSAQMFDLMTGLKGKAKLNYMETNPVLQNASDCGWSESGSTTFTQREIDPKYLKINMAFCDKKLLPTVHQHAVKVAAGIKSLPFEEEWTKSIADKVAAAIEHLIYFGNGANDNEFDGLVTILEAASAVTTNVSAVSGTSAYAFLKDVAKAIPAQVKNPVILVSTSLYREYMQDLVSANLYHFDPADGGDGYMLPGTNIKVIGVEGLIPGASDQNDYALAGAIENFVYGVDLEGDSDTFDIWYSKDNKEFRLDCEFIAGTQVKFPAEVTVGKRARA